VESDRWKRLEEIFFEALERPVEERREFLRRACGDDSELEREVETLLRAHETGAGATGAEGLLPSLDPPERGGALIGSRLGVYRIEALIGRGGMGEVYRASRDDEAYRQQVAVKVVRSGSMSPESVRRFRLERQVLATLQHPHIATLLDGGVTPSGEPYLVMQFVDGLPITRYAIEKKLTIEQRLRLFITAAEAVQYAHRHLIVHRDLKPSNILISSDGQPLLLDFGIAKLLHAESSEPATTDLLALTPGYAAPEQYLGAPVTTATDVYALGVLLYELLSGVHPFRGLGPVEMARAVCELDPAPPSAQAPPGIARELRGDLDHMVLMAVRREPERRYASAGQLAEDVTRHLAGQPVIAQPDRLGYRIGKFVRRNRVAVAAGALVVAVLVGAVIVTSRESARRAEALRVANAERATATRIADFMLDVFSASDPSEARGRTVTARELLDRATAGVKSGLGDEPSVRMDLQLAMGRAYQSLGLVDQAGPLVDEVARDRRAQQPRDPLKLATAIEWQARSAYARGRPGEGVALLRESLALREEALGPTDLVVGRTLALLAGYYYVIDVADTSGQGERTARRALEIFRASTPPAHRDIALALRSLGVAQLDREGRRAEALNSFRQALAEARQELSEDDPALFNHYEDLGLAFIANGQVDSAIAIHRHVLAARERVFGPDHPDCAFSLFNLARSLARAGRFEEALPLFQRAVDVRERALGREHYLVGFALHSYAVATAQSGDLPASAARFERAASVLAASLGPGNLMVQDAYEGLAIVRTMMGQRGAALEALESAVEAGYQRPERLAQEPFVRLTGDPRYRALLEKMKPPAS
jgi:serine/threonine-protein kinase